MYIFIEIPREFKISRDPQPNIMIRDGVGAVTEGTTLVSIELDPNRSHPIPRSHLKITTQISIYQK